MNMIIEIREFIKNLIIMPFFYFISSSYKTHYYAETHSSRYTFSFLYRVFREASIVY